MNRRELIAGAAAAAVSAAVPAVASAATAKPMYRYAGDRAANYCPYVPTVGVFS